MKYFSSILLIFFGFSYFVTECTSNDDDDADDDVDAGDVSSTFQFSDGRRRETEGRRLVSDGVMWRGQAGVCGDIC